MTVWMKPISTLMKPLRSVDLSTMAEAAATIERSDACAVPAAAVVGEAMVSLILADALLEKFGGDSVAEIDAAWERYQDALSARLAPGRSLPDVVRSSGDGASGLQSPAPRPPSTGTSRSSSTT